MGDIRTTGRTIEIGRLAASMSKLKDQSPIRQALSEHMRLQERQAVQSLRAQTSIPAGRVKSVTRSSVGGGGTAMSGKVTVADAPIPLAKYGKGEEGSVGVQASGWGKRRVFPGTFIVSRYGGNIYRRLTKKRFPIKRLWGPFLPNELLREDGDSRVVRMARRLAERDLEKRVMDAILRRI